MSVNILNEMADIKYTIIIPHYNSPEMLERLLKFTPPQLSDCQIVVIDDASNKSCVEKLHALEGKFENVEWVYLTQNIGGGGTRNIGLDKAKGEYVIFADADDFFLPTFATILDKYADEHEADIIFCNAISLYNETYLPCGRVNHLQKFIQQAETDYEQAELNLRYLFGEPWCRIIKRDTIEKYAIRFDQIKSHNDTSFAYLLGYYAKKILVEKTAIYCVTRSAISVSTENYKGKLENRVNVFSRKNKFLADHNIPVFDYWMIDPLGYAISKRDWPLLKKLRQIAECNGIEHRTLMFWIFKIYVATLINKLRFR
jgi:glycosyltransferase involved in cell wall biosynthesis